MPDDTPFSLDSAVALMTAPATPAADAATGAPAAEPEKKDTPPAGQDTSAPSTTPAAETADTPAVSSADGKDTPQDNSGETQDGQAEPGQLPPIEPPSSWKAEEKEVFKSLPREAQEAISRREQDRTTELRRLQNDTADQRKAADAEVVRLKGLADQIDNVIQQQVNTIARDFPDIKTQADIDALAASDPGRFAQFQARLMRFNADNEAKATAQRELAAKAQTQIREAMAMSHKELVTHFPTWSDPVAAKKELTEIQDYAISLGASEQAARAVYDPMTIRLAQKAMLYDRAQAQLAKARDTKPAPVVKPGTPSANPKADRVTADKAAAMRKLASSGDIEDARSLMLVK